MAIRTPERVKRPEPAAEAPAAFQTSEFQALPFSHCRHRLVPEMFTLG